MILVVGATGLVGSRICRKLVANGEAVRALVRTTSDPGKVAALRELGAEVVEGDLRDRGSLDLACRHVSTVISTTSSMPFSYEPDVNDIRTTDLDGQFDLVDAAAESDVRHFIYLSFSGQLDLTCPLRDAKRAVEGYLRTTPMTHTILRPSYFMEVWLSPAVGFDPAGARATIYGTGANPISWIAIDDVAEFAVRSITAPAARNATLELGGPQPLTPLEAVHAFEAVAGRPFQLEFVPDSALRSRQQAASDPMEESFATLMRCYAQGDPIEMGATMKAFPFPLTTVPEYAAAVLGRVTVPA